MNEGYRTLGALKSVLKNRGFGINAKTCLYERVVVPAAFGWRSLVGLPRMDRVKNEEVSSKAGIERELASGSDLKVLDGLVRWR